MSEIWRSDVQARCEDCDDLICLGDEYDELAGELFHAECV